MRPRKRITNPRRGFTLDPKRGGGKEGSKSRLKWLSRCGAKLPRRPEEPKARRYIVTDRSYESLGQLFSCNSNGLLAFRDELISLLKTLEILAISKRR